ncbi:MAG: hypothetical protein AAB521_01150 [Patescibacteria group bacterium]
MDENLDKKSPAQSSDSVSFSRKRSLPSTVWNQAIGLFSNRVTAIAGILVLVLGLGAGVIAVQRSTEYRQQAATSSPPLPGTCLVLPQEFCATGKPVLSPEGKFAGLGFTLPAGTPIFAYDSGILVSSFTSVGTSTYRGYSLTPKGQAININAYFKDGATSGNPPLSRDVTKGSAIGHANKDPRNQYDLLINFSKLGINIITIDQGLTTTNFSQ